MADSTGSVGRVLVLRPDNLGDLVLFSGAFRHVRRRFPNAEITVCVKEYAMAWLARCPYFDRLEPWEPLQATAVRHLPPMRGRERLRRLVRPVQLRLRARFDVILLPVRSATPEMHEVALGLRSKSRYGIAGDFSNQSPAHLERVYDRYTAWLDLPPDRKTDPELAVTRDFLRFIGCPVTDQDVLPEVWIGDTERAWARATMPTAGDRLVLGIAPGAGSIDGKAYPVDRYAAALAECRDVQLDVVMFGGAADAARCAALDAALQACPAVASVRDLSGGTTLPQLNAAIERCDLVLAVDTAALHIATALRRPTVGIMGGGHFGRFYPWGDPAINRMAHQPMPCYWCNWICRYETVRCVHEIPASGVARELAVAIEAARRHRSVPGSPVSGQGGKLEGAPR